MQSRKESWKNTQARKKAQARIKRKGLSEEEKCALVREREEEEGKEESMSDSLPLHLC